MYILDTNICVFHLRGKISLKKLLSDKKLTHCYISEVTYLELLYGAELSRNLEKSMKSIYELMENIEIIPISICYEIYGSEKKRLQKIGRPVHDEFDFLIALTTISKNYTLVTDNLKDFQNFSNLKTENWIER